MKMVIRYKRPYKQRVYLTPRPKKSLESRFLSHVDKNADGHWYWTGALDKDDYGKFSDENYKHTPAHVISYRLYKNDYDSTLYTLHKCDMRNCVNPEHLEQGTQKKNCQDCSRRNRHASTGFRYKSLGL